MGLVRTAKMLPFKGLHSLLSLLGSVQIFIMSRRMKTMSRLVQIDLFSLFITHFSLETPKKGKRSSADPDQILQNVESDQGLHCLH